MIKWRLVFILIISVYTPQVSYGQEISDFFIQHYHKKKDHNLAKYCYSIVQDRDSKMIFTATYYGLNYFTGNAWRSNPVDKSFRGYKRFQKLVKDNNIKNKYYVGGLSQCGIFTVQNDSIAYRQVLSIKENKQRLGGRLIKIYQIKGKVYYMGISTGVCIYNERNKTRKFIAPLPNLSSKVTYFKDGYQIFAKTQNGTVYALKNSQWLLQKNSVFESYNLKHYHRFNDTLSLIIDENGKLFLKFGDKKTVIIKNSTLLSPKEDHFISKLKGSRIYLIVGNKLLSYNILKGKLKLLKNFSRFALHDFTFDNNSNIWISTNDGVLFVELNKALRVKKNPNNVYKRFTLNNIRFDILKGEKALQITKVIDSVGTINYMPSKTISGLGRIDNVVVRKQRFFICSETGIYELNDTNFNYTQKLKGSFQNIFIKEEKEQNNYQLIAFGPFGVKVLDDKFHLLAESKLNNNKIIFYSTLYQGDIFYSTKSELFKVSLQWKNKEGIKVKKIKFNSKVRHDFTLKAFNNKLFIINALGLFTYNNKTGIAEEFTRYITGIKKNRFGRYNQSFSNFLKITNSEFLVSPVMLRDNHIKESFPVIVEKKGVKNYQMDSYGLRRIGEAYITSLHRRPDGIIEMIGQDKIIEYDYTQKRSFKLPFKAYIRRVSIKKKVADTTRNINFEDQPVHFGFTKQSQIPRLTYQHNALTLNYASDSWVASERNEYSYQLVGQDDTWSNWSKEQKKEYTHLREGNYTFQVRCRNIYGIISSIDSYTFTILPPWYRTWWAYVLYSLMAIGLLVGGSIGYSRFRNRQIRYRNQELERVVKERTEEIRSQKEEITQQAEELKTTNEELIKANEQIQYERDEKIKVYMQEATDATSKLQEIRQTLAQKGAATADKMLSDEINTASEFVIIRDKVRNEFPDFAEKIDQALADKDITKFLWQVGHCIQLGMTPMDIADVLHTTNRSVSTQGNKLRKKGLLPPLKK